jgi:hypothetical protein
LPPNAVPTHIHARQIGARVGKRACTTQEAYARLSAGTRGTVLEGSVIDKVTIAFLVGIARNIRNELLKGVQETEPAVYV